jgi:fucose permease
VEKLKVLRILSVFVALVIEQAIRVRRIFICGLFFSTIFSHINSAKALFFKKSY